jgi:ABC-type phosphate transport system substrate-binding protein
MYTRSAGSFCLVMLFVLGTLLGSATGARAAQYWYYSYRPGNGQDCWQTGQLGAESLGCDAVGPGFFEQGHLTTTEGLELPTSGDYCIPYGIAKSVTLRDPNNEWPATGFETPTPYSSYQQWDEHGDVCQGSVTEWGQEIRKSECNAKTCGMHHYVSLGEQGQSELPWSAPFGNPSLIVSTEADIQTLSPGGDAAWGYVCPLFQAVGTPVILEYCIQEWRGSGNAKPEWESERIGSCAEAKHGTVALDTVQTFFYPGARFATIQPGSAETHVAAAGWKKYIAAISPSNLRAAIELDRKAYVEKKENHSGEATPELGYGCGRTEAQLPSNPADYALVGIEQGVEGWNFSEIGASADNMQVYGEYTPRAPEVEAVEPGVQPNAKLFGKVNPEGQPTQSWFEYGPTPSYGSSTFHAYTGSIASWDSVEQPIDVETHATYNFRLVAENANGETTYGKNQSFSTPGPTVSLGTPEPTFHSAILHGSVNPEGFPTTYIFEYGLSPGHVESQVPFGSAEAGSGTSSVPVSAPTEHLKAGTTYYYQLYAVDSRGWVTLSPEGSLTTPIPVPSVAAEEATELQRHQAKLPGLVNPEGFETHYYFEYGMGGLTNIVPALPGTSVGSGENSVPVAVTATGLEAGKTYSYRLVAVNAGGAEHSKTHYFTLPPPEQCEGGNVSGIGASLEKLAQVNVWTGGFNTSSSTEACSGTQGTHSKPTVTYVTSSSSKGLRTWGAEASESKEIAFGPSDAFIATAEAPNATQISEIISHETSPTEKTLETFPVAQFALAVYVHLPTGCTANSAGAEGRLVLTDAVLQGIYEGSITKWGQITGDEDKVTGTGCAEAAIVPVVRKEKAGTTNVLKKFLGGINKGTLSTSKGSKTWDQLAEGELNAVWPSAVPVVATTAEGDLAEIEKVSSTAGSIGYSNLAELRATGLFSPATSSKFWVKLESEVNSKGVITKYADPASNSDVAAAAGANCKNTVYEWNGVVNSWPYSWNSWSGVTTQTYSKTYPLCGLMYMLAFKSYHLLPGTTELESTTVSNYAKYVLSSSKGGGQLAIGEKRDYERLSTEALTNAKEGAQAIEY